MRLGSVNEDYRASHEYRVEDACWIVVVERMGPPLRKRRQQLKITGREMQIRDLWEGCRQSSKCSRDTYPESYITKYTRIRRLQGVI